MFPSICSLLRFFFLSWMDIGFCQVLVLSQFVWSYDCSLKKVNYIDFQWMNQLFVTRINYTCSLYIILSIYCWTLLTASSSLIPGCVTQKEKPGTHHPGGLQVLCHVPSSPLFRVFLCWFYVLLSGRNREKYSFYHFLIILL